MSDLINLKKQVKITLEKRKAPTIVTQVGVSFDISGSTQHFYGKGPGSYIQALVDRIFAIAVTFDDNGALNAWVFDSMNSQVTDIVIGNYETYVKKHILDNNAIHKWGTTNYHAVIDAINKYYNFPDEVTGVAEAVTGIFTKIKSAFSFGKKKAAVTPVVAEPVSSLPDPAYILFVTDGAPDSQTLAEAAIESTKDDRIFWQFAGIEGTSTNYEFLKRLARDYGNVSFDTISPTATTDAELYEKLISAKFVAWYSNLPK